MANDVSGNPRTIWVRGLFILWSLLTLAMAFFIPVFDFGFDGVVLWLVYSIVLLAAMTLLILGLKYGLQKSPAPEKEP